MPIITISKALSGEFSHCLATNFSWRLNGPWQVKAVIVDSVGEKCLPISKSTVNEDLQVVGFKVSKYSSVRCLTCPNLTTDEYLKSNITHQKFNIINHFGEDLSCHAQNLIYLLS